jgi:predicted alpha/beta superfamily hydrolase
LTAPTDRPLLTEVGFAFGDGHRRARVYVPPRVDTPARLLILFDGQNVFGDDESFSGGWQAHSAVARLPSTVHQPIVVGVDHGHEQRIDELWPRLDSLLDALRSRLLPTLRERWEIAPGPIVAGGSSLGGLAALAAHLRDRDTFGGAMCLSPSFWVEDGAIFRELPTLPPAAAARVYLDVGGRESPKMVHFAARMAGELGSRGYRREQVLWRPDARGTHHERHWRRRLPKALRFLFRKG